MNLKEIIVSILKLSSFMVGAYGIAHRPTNSCVDFCEPGETTMHGTTEAAMLMLQFGTLAVLILPMVAQAVPKLGSALEDKKYEKYVHIPIDQKLHHKLFVALKLPERFTSVSEQAAPRQSLIDLEAQISAYKYKRTELQLPVISIASKMLHVSPIPKNMHSLTPLLRSRRQGAQRQIQRNEFINDFRRVCKIAV